MNSSRQERALPKFVLVLDDDEGFLDAVLRLLRISGIDANGARNMDELIGALPLPAGACILADIMLRGESGLDVPALLAARGERVPVVFVSATDDETTIHEATRLSGVSCLAKPVEVEDLLTGLSEAMHRAAGRGIGIRPTGK
jgi:FixJ family two-component response regulator